MLILFNQRNKGPELRCSFIKWLKLAWPLLPITICTMYYQNLSKDWLSYGSGRTKNIVLNSINCVITKGHNSFNSKAINLKLAGPHFTFGPNLIEILQTIGKLWLWTDKKHKTYRINYTTTQGHNSLNHTVIYSKLAEPHYTIVFLKSF